MRQCLDYWKGIGPETVRQLRLQALSTNSTFWEIIKNIANNLNAFQKMRQRNKVSTFYTYMSNLRRTKKFLKIVNNFFDVVPESNEDNGCRLFLEYLRKFQNQEDAVTLEEVIEDFEQHMESGGLENKYKKKNNNVRVMTMHSAKGCEAPIVIIPALEDDIMPGNARNINIEEKRRLFYVSLTRAKYGVYLSWASQRAGQEIHKIAGRKMLGKRKSIFLNEIEK
jgi:DNA helicase-2/ATP-dependent DNA helicase PcrA